MSNNKYTRNTHAPASIDSKTIWRCSAQQSGAGTVLFAFNSFLIEMCAESDRTRKTIGRAHPKNERSMKNKIGFDFSIARAD